MRDALRRFNSTSQTTQIVSSATAAPTEVEGAVYFVRILIQPEIERESAINIRDRLIAPGGSNADKQCTF